MLSAKELHKLQERREKRRVEVYHRIIKKIFLRIKALAQRGDEGTFYTVPDFIPGLPTYDLVHCINYITIYLQNEGFFVKYTPPNLLYINWKKPNQDEVEKRNTKVITTNYEHLKNKTKDLLKRRGHFTLDDFT